MSLDAETLTNVKPDMIVMDQEILGYPFVYHRIQGTPLYKSDMEYIDNVIKKDKIYRMIAHAYNTREKVDYYKLFIEDCNTIQFLGKFLDDSQCPARVKNFLYTFIGEQLGHFKRQGLYQDYVQHSFLTQRWMEICR